MQTLIFFVENIDNLKPSLAYLYYFWFKTYYFPNIKQHEEKYLKFFTKSHSSMLGKNDQIKNIKIKLVNMFIYILSNNYHYYLNRSVHNCSDII